jgi:hypothetical protein
MHRRLAVALLVALVTLAGCAALSPTGAPLLTVDNRDDTEYRLSVYALPDVENPGDLTVRATDGNGDRRSVSPADLRTSGSYRNVTLEGTDVTPRHITLRAAANTSAAINVWNPGDATVYVIETTDGTASLVGVHVVTCGTNDQEHATTIANGTIDDRSMTCP